MPITIAQMASDAASVTFTYAGQEVNVTYSPSGLTEKVFADLATVADSGQLDIAANTHALNDVIVAVVTRWDVLNDDGSMYPITPLALATLPILFRAEVVKQVLGAFSPNAIGAMTTESAPSLSTNPA
jgi:hypothetical protein